MDAIKALRRTGQADTAAKRAARLRETLEGIRHRALNPPAARPPVPRDIHAAVEAGIVEEPAATKGYHRTRSLGKPTATGPAENARDRFNSLQPNYANRLGVGPGGQVHHAIELQVLDRYPGAYTERELNAFQNMRGIPPENVGRRQLHNSKIRSVWNRHYAELDADLARQSLKPGTPAYNRVVRAHISAARDEIDAILGQFFSEQRRLVFPRTP
jgi:hypothetical protein